MATLGEFKYNELLVEYAHGEEGVIENGQNLEAGSVLGKVTDTGKLKLSDNGASDGSEVPYAVLLKDTDASSGDRIAPILKAGKVNENYLVFGGSHTADSTRDKMRELGIYYVKGVEG